MSVISPEPMPEMMFASPRGPLGATLPLTLSGNEITDGVRAAALQGDGLSPDGSMGVWEATTNVVLNGGCETNTTNIGANGSCTVSRETAKSKFGSACLKAVTNGVGATEGANYAPQSGTAAPSDVWTVSGWVYHEEGSDVSIDMRISWRNSGDGLVSEVPNLVNVPSGVWTRVITTATAPAATDRARAKVVTGAKVAVTFWVDGVQAEKQPLATPCVPTDGGTASRSASRVQVPVAGVIDETQGWLAARLRMDWVNTADPSGNPVVFDWRDDASNLLQLRFDTAADQWELQRRNGGGTGEAAKADTFSLGDAVTVIAAWTATTLKVSVDGSVFTTAAAANIPTLAASTLDIGSVAGTSEHIDADVFWAACGTGTLADADAAAIHANGNPEPTPGLFPDAADLTMIWKPRNQIARRFTP